MTSDLKSTIAEVVASMEEELISVRRHLHQHPELSHQEEKTGSYLLAQLQRANVLARGSVGGHGVIAEIEGGRPGPLVAFRVDMDALPIQERSGLSFASQVPGVMHACGHDAHMTIGLGVARTLHTLRDRLAGRVRVFFQPAEESVPSGADLMIEAGVMEGVSAIWTVHVEPALPSGTIGLREGAITAGTDAFTIRIQGKSGHSARPHLARDANFAAAEILSAIYHFAATQFDPREPMVVNVGVMRGGEAPNAIAGEATLEGVIRTLSPSARAEVPERLKALVEGIASAHRVEATLDLRAGSPSQINDPALTRLTEEAVCESLGASAVVHIPLPSMGGEDFSRYTSHCPGVLVRLGNALPGEEHSLHSESFVLDESVLAIGTRVIAQTLFRFNEKGTQG